MDAAFWGGWPKPSMSGGSATSRAVNWPTGRTASCTTSASPRAMRFTRPQNRSGGAASELPPSLLEQFMHIGEAERFSVVATMLVDGHEIIVGEARYAFEDGSIEFGLSVDDRWQGHGIGKALLKNLECRAASFGAERLFGDTLRSNDAMISLARKSGYGFLPSPGDWKLV